jgi:selenocysteine lyase/cysteine desulfurase
MYENLIIGSESLVKLYNDNEVHYINFDNAATTPPFKSVLSALNNFSPFYSSVHRGTGYKSIISSNVYEEGRDIVLDFVKGNADYHTVIFLKHTTECINKLSYRLQGAMKDKVVLTTYMEHHSNMLPWRNKYETDYVEVDSKGRLCIEDLEFKLRLYRGKVGLVCVTGASNVTGYTNNVHKIAKLCHKYGAKIFVDGAQTIPHTPFDMKPIDSPEHIDFLAFSAHKMYAPFGIGALIAPKEVFLDGCSELVGGGTVKFVSPDDVIWAEPPEKEEAGTPNLMGVVALIESIKTLQNIGMNYVEEYEKRLTSYALHYMKEIPNIIIYDDFNIANKVSIIPFNIKGLHHTQLAYILGQEGGIAVRNGCFCAQPYVQRLLNIPREDVKNYRAFDKDKLPGMVRISFGLYNNFNEIDLFIYILRKIASNIPYYQSKYRNVPLE